MPAACLICGANKKADSKVKLFHFAVISQKTGHLHEVSKRRRHEWLRVLRKTEEDLKEAGSGHYICSQHFKSGEPAKVQDVTDPDWVPSQHLTTQTIFYTKKRKSKKSQSQIEKSEHPVEKIDPPAAKFKKTTAKTSIGMDPDSKDHSQDTHDVSVTKSETIAKLNWMIAQKDQLIHCLQVKLQHHEIDESSFIHDDLKTQFYTGFATYKCFAAFASTVEPLLVQNVFPGVSRMKMLIIVMIKLRLNLPIAYMSLKFEIPFEALSEIFTSSVRKLADHLQVTFPGTRKIPKFLKNVFGEQLAVIVDIFELELDFGSGSFQSIKLLIAYSPCGRISFVSKPFSGASTDKWIFNTSGLLKQLKANDLVLALRSSLNEDIITPGGYRDKISLYGLGNLGLVRLQWDHSHGSELRTNLRAVLDQLTTIFGFLIHKQPEMWMKDPTVFLGKVVMLCAALRNLILPV